MGLVVKKKKKLPKHLKSNDKRWRPKKNNRQGSNLSKSGKEPIVYPDGTFEKPYKHFKSHGWKPEYLVTIYELVKDGWSKQKIAAYLGVHKELIYNWIKLKPELKAMVKKAEQLRDTEYNLKDFISGRLPPRLKKIWDEVKAFDEKDPTKAMRVAYLRGQTQRVQQWLFVHAYVSNGFQMAKAMRTSCISERIFKDWAKNDPEFVDLISEIHSQLKYFYQDALNRKVAEGDTSAILFANKTFNKELYGNHLQIDMKVSEAPTEVTELLSKIPVEQKKALLQALRNGQQATLPNPDVQDAEFTVKGQDDGD